MDGIPNLNGWVLDLKAVYGSGWKEREEWRLREDLWESPGQTTAALLYRIAEVGVSKEVGRLALFRNKEKPELVFNFPDLTCWYLHSSAVQFMTEDLLFVHRFKDGRSKLGVRVCALDLAARRFALVDALPERFYGIRSYGGSRYVFARQEEGGAVQESLVDLQSLDWRPLSDSSDFHPDDPWPRRALQSVWRALGQN